MKTYTVVGYQDRDNEAITVTAIEGLVQPLDILAVEGDFWFCIIDARDPDEAGRIAEKQQNAIWQYDDEEEGEDGNQEVRVVTGLIGFDELAKQLGLEPKE